MFVDIVNINFIQLIACFKTVLVHKEQLLVGLGIGILTTCIWPIQVESQTSRPIKLT